MWAGVGRVCFNWFNVGDPYLKLQPIDRNARPCPTINAIPGHAIPNRAASGHGAPGSPVGEY